MISSKNTKKNVKFIYVAVFLLLIFLFVFNLSVVSNRIVDKVNIDNEVDEINEVLEATDNDGSVQDSAEKTKSEPNTDYWNYLKISLDKVNISELKKLNNETVGFLNISGTKINYPVVQSKDNRYYLNHSFKKRSNSCGWLFMDYRNSAESLDRNTIIYGHSNIDKTMFGSLSDILSAEWRTNIDNGDITYINLSEKTKWKIISAYTIAAEGYYLKTNFESEEEFSKWVNEMAERSIYNFGYKYSEGDKVITLSTCYKDEGNIRLVVHAKKL